MKKSLFIVPLLFICLSYNFSNLSINTNKQNSININYPQKKLPSKWWYN
ncbi:hypothetical protein ABFP60_01135 [Clostridioides difficile]